MSQARAEIAVRGGPTSVARPAADVRASPAAGQLFAGEGEMRRRARACDWSATPLGAVDGWSQSLRTTATTVLATGFPAILLWGPRLVQIYNDAYIQFLGVKHPAALGMEASECWRDLWPLVEPTIERVLAGETVTLSDQHYPLLRRGAGAGADDVYITLSYVPVRDESGGVSGIIVTGIDTTAHVERVRFDAERSRLIGDLERLVARAESARAAAERAREQADIANRAKGAFLAVMSHELRTPLTAIGGYAELIEMGLRGPVTPEQLRDLRSIQQSQRHLLKLIAQVLDHTRVEMGATRYTLVDIPVIEAINAAEEFVIPQVRARNITYTVGACDRAVTVRADAGKLQQILLNLLGNAIKFTESGGRITVGCSANDETVTITVADTGIGIAPDKLDAVFEPFVQADADLTRRNCGVGLGLAISRDLARGMHGDLTAASVVGRGSTFTLTLPRA